MSAPCICNNILQPRRDGILDPRIATLLADECRNIPHNHDPELQVYSEGGGAGLFFTAAKWAAP